MKLVTDGEELTGLVDDLTTVYRDAFSAPGYDETEQEVERFRDEQLPAHAAREGFRCAVAFDDGVCVGFAYGYTGRRGEWWTDQVAAGAPAEIVEQWLDGHFEFVELAVDPAAQRCGHGAALHDALLLGVPNERALLTTYRDDRPAPRLYRRLGWELLVEGIFEDSDLYGLDLHRFAQRPER
ncbi:MAG TPA: GNAT family N-acetyltransferase [Gaiellaceae bacterium]|nr:GNAT family N-acetyltransferase [Gaiellaceae bacterium]